CQQYNGLPWTF
nr:immunoglobulin light chain junction region [Macaca mulatta]MOW74009.1 immunoglobulin light chain junction region [Macaca mulatta]MOY10533.1 immunoglobulin light chain junction region [Macaca mulatta]MOY10611.1 immunoglobulin light chain junction region [Macaca mulatta]MOY10662.1 immunoglobulin light chain junction region [Macaca mulatta]